jgi:hypothetical protein
MDVRALRAGLRPPYVQAIEQGRITPGARLEGAVDPRLVMAQPAELSKTRGPANPNRPEAVPAPAAPTAILGSLKAPAGAPAQVRIDIPPPSGGSAVARTLIDAPRVGATAPDPPQPAVTRNDRPARVGLVVIIVAVLALAAGIAVGIGLTTCRGDDAEPANAEPRDGGPPASSGSARARPR